MLPDTLSLNGWSGGVRDHNAAVIIRVPWTCDVHLWRYRCIRKGLSLWSVVNSRREGALT